MNALDAHSKANTGHDWTAELFDWGAGGSAAGVGAGRRSQGQWRLDGLMLTTIENGKRELWRSHSPQTTQSFIQRALISPDGRSTLIALSHGWHELYVVEGIR